MESNSTPPHKSVELQCAHLETELCTSKTTEDRAHSQTQTHTHREELPFVCIDKWKVYDEYVEYWYIVTSFAKYFTKGD